MIDDKLEDRDIGPLWAEHYPKCADRIMSKALCLTLFYIIADRAHSIYAHSDWSEKLQHALRFYGVSKEQYYENILKKAIDRCRAL